MTDDERLADTDTRWLEIPGFPHHQVSADGRRVRSVDRVDDRGRFWPGCELKLFDPKPGNPHCPQCILRAGGGGPRCSLACGSKRATFYPTRFIESRKAHP